MSEEIKKQIKTLYDDLYKKSESKDNFDLAKDCIDSDFDGNAMISKEAKIAATRLRNSGHADVAKLYDMCVEMFEARQRCLKVTQSIPVSLAGVSALAGLYMLYNKGRGKSNKKK
jgi:hypothetical protein